MAASEREERPIRLFVAAPTGRVRRDAWAEDDDAADLADELSDELTLDPAPLDAVKVPGRPPRE